MSNLDTRATDDARNDTADTEAQGAAQLAHAGRVVARVLKIGVGVAILAAMVLNFSPEFLRGFPIGYLFGAIFGFGLLIDGLLGTHFFKPIARGHAYREDQQCEISRGYASGVGRYGYLKPADKP